MKKILITSFLWNFFFLFSFSQTQESGHSIKRIEPNFLMSKGYYNTNIKEGDRLLFGDLNAPIEFYCLFGENSYGFRVLKDSLDTSYVLEIKYFSNYEEATKIANEKINIIDVPIELLNELPRNVFNLIFDYNSRSSINKRFFEERYKHLKVETLPFSITDQFAEKLYEKMVLFIDKFKVKGIPPISYGGYWVTFRNVVEDEVWSLKIADPQGDALKMSNLCRQIIKDAQANQLDEAKYISVLDTFEK